MTTQQHIWVTSTVTDKTLVVQHNKIIEARYKLSVGEQRLMKVLVSMIEPQDEDFKIYRIAVIDLMRLLDLSSNDFYRQVKIWSKNLVSSLLIFKSEGENELQLTWLSSAEYKQDEGVVELEFSPKLKPFLLQLKKHFTVYELENIIKLKRIYSIRIYELLKQYQGIGRRRFSLENLRKILMLEDGEYKGYKSFKRWVILPAQKELGEKTDISFTWNEEKKWREVVAIEFIIQPQTRPQNSSSKNKFINNNETQGEHLIKTVIDLPITDKQSNVLIDLLVALGVIRKASETLVKNYPEEQIKAAVAYTQSQQKEGKVKNPSGFVVEAIKNGYLDHQAEDRARKEKALQETKAREEHTQKWERLKTAYAEARKAMFEVWRSALSEQELVEHRERFMETLAPLVRKRKTMAEQAFLAHLKGLMPFPSLREWAGQSRLNIAEFEKEVAQEDRRAGVKDAEAVIAA